MGFDAESSCLVRVVVTGPQACESRAETTPARRAIHEPILRLARELEHNSGSRRIAVLIPEMITVRWYQYLLHVNRGRRLHARLMNCGDPRIMVIDVPWYWDDRGRNPARLVQRKNAS